jgi:hypothetical protein
MGAKEGSPVKDRRGPATVTGSVRRTRRPSERRSPKPLGSIVSWEGATEDPEARSLPPAAATTTLEEGKALMSIRSIALATATFALLATGSATAAPTTVQLRIEGSAGTIFEGPVTTDGHSIDKGDGPHPCDGTTRTTPPLNSGPGPTVTSALDDADRQAGFTWSAQWFSFGDFLVSQIGPDAPPAGSSTYWGTVLNYQPTPVGGCQQQVAEGDEVLFALGDIYSQDLLRLTGPGRARAGAPVRVTVDDGKTGAPSVDATVGGVQTAPDGSATLAFGSPGLVRLKAEKAGAIRSNAVNLCVSENGTGNCGVAPTQLGVPTAGKPVKDSVAPSARIAGPRDGRRYRVGPRLLSGTAADDVGVTKVKLALRRHARGERCRWWSGTTERFTGRGCEKKVFFHIDAGSTWSYLLPRKLAPGRYVLDVKAFDRARNRNERFVRGSNRVVFYVGRGYGARATVSSRAKSARVHLQLASRSKTSAAVVRARPTLVEAGARTCRVGASTPLAALAALLRKEDTGYAIRDYGRCSRTTATGSGQLFVRRIGTDSNSGNDGWFYKVNDRAPEVGAGDPTARLRTGARLLWFYCVFDEGIRSCQRSLRIVPANGSASGDLRVAVRGYDNAGHWVRVAGATVAIGPTTAVSGVDGLATLAANRGPGRYRITASKAGMIDAFPVTVAVK